jgi:hypothetical protein
MQVNDLESQRRRQLNVLERLRELLLTLEREAELSTPLYEQVLATRLQMDCEIEAPRG